MFKITPSATDLSNVGPAQQPTQFDPTVRAQELKAQEHNQWYKRVRDGTHKLLNGPRRHMIPPESQQDLLQCLELMACKEPLKFDWDITLYTTPTPLRAPRVQSATVGQLEGDFSRPDLHLIATEAPPWWALARFAFFFFFCFFLGFFLRFHFANAMLFLPG